MTTNTIDESSTTVKERLSIPSDHSSIQITYPTNRSIYMHLLQLLIKPFRLRLSRPKEQNPEISPKLSPRSIFHRGCIVSERAVCGIHIYDIIPKKGHNHEIRKRIYYFCGGSWQELPSSQHWQVCAEFAREMPDTIVSIVSHPLGPTNAAPSSFPKLLRLYRTLLKEADRQAHKAILAGDSSGGNIILCLVLEALREDLEAIHLENTEPMRIPHPTAIMAIGPSTDLTRSNPDIENLESLDPFLTIPVIRQTAKTWYGGWDPADRRVSPINANISLLAERGIRMHGVTGGFDILTPDAVKFRDLCAEKRVSGQWLHWENQMHCFVLTWSYGFPEGKEALNWVINILKHE